MKILKRFFAIIAFFTIFAGLNVVSCVSKDVRAIKTGDVIYFDTKGLNDDWDNVKIYFFSTWGGSEIVSWNDSVNMEKIDGTTVFKYTVPESLNAESHNNNMLIFQNGKGGNSNQTIDLAFIDTGYAYAIDSTEDNKQKGYWYVYDKSELVELYNSFKDYEEMYYTSDTWSDFANKLLAASDAINNEIKIGNNDTGGFTSIYEDVTIQLRTAENNLIVNKEILKNKIDEVKQVNTNGYTISTVDELNRTIEDAEDKYNSADITVNDIKEQINNLNDAVSALEVDKMPLKQKLDEAKAIDLNGYTTDTVDALNDTIAKAEEKYNSSDITVSDVETWVKNLDDAISALKVDKSELELLIELVNIVLDNYTKYIDTTSLQEMKDILSMANEVVDDEDASVADVNNSITKIQDKVNKLKFNRELIVALINKANGIDFDKYTEESVNVLKEKIVKAEELLKQDKITIEEFDTVEKEVNDAINGLVEKASIISDNNEVINENKNPNTGTYIVIVIVVIVIALIVLIVTTLYNKNKKNPKSNKDDKNK